MVTFVRVAAELAPLALDLAASGDVFDGHW